MVSCLDTGRRIFNFFVCVINEERSRKGLEEEEYGKYVPRPLSYGSFFIFKHVECIGVFPGQLLLSFGAMSEMFEDIERAWKGQRKGEFVDRKQQPS